MLWNSLMVTQPGWVGQVHMVGLSYSDARIKSDFNPLNYEAKVNTSAYTCNLFIITLLRGHAYSYMR